jgi:hypothetical protein
MDYDEILHGVERLRGGQACTAAKHVISEKVRRLSIHLHYSLMMNDHSDSAMRQVSAFEQKPTTTLIYT